MTTMFGRNSGFPFAKFAGIGGVVILVIWAIITANGLSDLVVGIEAADDSTSIELNELTEIVTQNNLIVEGGEAAYYDALEKIVSNGGNVQAFMVQMNQLNPQQNIQLRAKQMDTLEAKFNDFSRQQKIQVDQVRTLKTRCGRFPDSIICGLTGKGDQEFLDRYGKPILNAKTQRAAETRTMPQL